MPRPVKGNFDGAVVSGFFIVSPTSAVLHTIARVQPDCVEEKGTRYDLRLGGSSRRIRGAGLICKPRGVG